MLYERCESWKNKEGKTITTMSTCQANKTWTDPLLFPPGPLATRPLPLKSIKPDDPDILCESGCLPLNLTYNPNEELGAGFHCKTPLDWASLPVMVEPSNQCHLLCDKLLVAVVSCKEGIWTGNPKKGFWCHQVKEGVGYWHEEIM